MIIFFEVLMLSIDLVKELQRIVGDDNVATDKQDLICYGYDATQMEFLPSAVVHPANAEETAAVLNWPTAVPFPVFPVAPAAALPAAPCPRPAAWCW
jgi:glycolate oxidase